MGATNALMELPRCPIHKTQMILRKNLDEIADYCGTWYECPEKNCLCTVLFESKELLAQLDEMTNHTK